MRWRYFLFTCILLIGAGLRFHLLDAQSFWHDEGNTARLVERSIPLIIEGAAGDIHPPGYYLLLHIWRTFAGESEFALRAYSAFCGILTLAVAGVIGRRAGGWQAGLGAAFFVAVHPLAIYYSQEARMYAQLGLVSALTLWLATYVFAPPRKKALVSHPLPFQKSASYMKQVSTLGTYLTFSLTIAAGLYTQYAYIFALFGLSLAFAIVWVLRRPWHWRQLGVWIAVHILGGVLFLPWAHIALRARGWHPPDLDAAHAVQAITRALLAGVTLPGDASIASMLVALLLLGLALLTHPKMHFAKWAALAMALVPPLLIVLLGLYRPAYLKFLMASLPPLAAVVALPLSDQHQGAGKWRAKVGWVLLLALLPVQMTALQHLYTDPAYARDDYRGLAARIAAEGQRGDAVLLSAPNQWEVFTYYYKGPLPVYPAPYRPTPTEAAHWIEDIVARHSQLFVLYWGDTESDPDHYVESRLAQFAYKASDHWISTVRLARYGTAPLSQTPTTITDAQFGAHISLEGYTLPQHTYMAGDIVPLTLFWKADAPPAQRYKVFVHLVDESGALAAQTDAEPGGGFVPTTTWQPAHQVIDRYGIFLPADLSSGAYTLNVGMYNFSGERLRLIKNGEAAGDVLVLSQVQIVQN